MMLRKIVAILSVIVTMVSCQKDESPLTYNSTYQDDYRFYTRAKVNGLPVDFYAGDNGYGLETDYSIDSGIVIMSGTLSTGDAMLKNAIVLRMRGNEKVSVASDFQVGQALRPGLYSYRDRSGYSVVPGEYELQFFGDTNLYPASFHWQFQDSTESFVQNPPIKQVNSGNHDPFTVSLTTNYYGCQSSVVHHVNVEDDCDATFNMTSLSSYGCAIEVIARHGNLLSVDWTLDGSSVSPDFSGNINTTYISGKHELKAEMFFEDGCTKVVERHFNALGGADCLGDFWFNKNQVTVYDSEQLGSVELEYYDETGKMFSTYYSDVNGKFKIASLSPYKENALGQQTTRFFFEANAVLKSSDGSSVELTECFGSFAVAHP